MGGFSIIYLSLIFWLIIFLFSPSTLSCLFLFDKIWILHFWSKNHNNPYKLTCPSKKSIQLLKSSVSISPNPFPWDTFLSRKNNTDSNTCHTRPRETLCSLKNKNDKQSPMPSDISRNNTMKNWARNFMPNSNNTDIFTCTDSSLNIDSEHTLIRRFQQKLKGPNALCTTFGTIWTLKWLSSPRSWSLTEAMVQFFQTGHSFIS